MKWALLQELRAVTGERYVHTDEETKSAYAHDQSPLAAVDYDVVVRPATVQEIAAIVVIAATHQVPVTPRGGGTGVTGGAVPMQGGIVLSLERLNSIVDIDLANRYAIVEAGVITQDLCNALEAAGMYFPIAPGSKGSSFIGGNIATNAGSPKSCKYGTVGDFVLNLQVVLGTGEITWTGANVYKDATGLNVTHLFVGSEGVLGIITKAVIRIIPRPMFGKTLLAGFSQPEQACRAALELARSAICPAALELITASAIELTRPYLSATFPMLQLPVRAMLLIEWEEYCLETIDKAVRDCYEILEVFEPVDVFIGAAAAETTLLWSMRHQIGEAMTRNGYRYRDIDACVPPANVYHFLDALEQLEKKYAQQLICFGHVMDGNLHTMLLMPPESRMVDQPLQKKLITEIYKTAIRLGGTISGEHGIGCLQTEFLPLRLSCRHMELMQQIKRLMDPGGILNPGKFFIWKKEIPSL